MNEPKNFTILVVDDEDALRRTIVFDFKRKGFKVFDANNGKSAFELVKGNQVHLVISDIRMPGGDGIALLEQIRAYDSKLPIVVLITGFSEFSEAECVAKGAQNVLSKPFDRKTLMGSVLKALNISQPSLTD